MVSDRKLTFAVLSVEAAAKHMNTTPADVFNRLEKIGLAKDILFDGYDMLHTQSAEYIGEFVADAIMNHEKKAKA